MKQDGVLLYPIRADLPVSWSSHLDVAEVAKRLLTDHTVTGIVGVGHQPGMRGAALADGFSARFDRPVQFEAQAPEDFTRRSLNGPGYRRFSAKVSLMTRWVLACFLRLATVSSQYRSRVFMSARLRNERARKKSARIYRSGRSILRFVRAR